MLNRVWNRLRGPGPTARLGRSSIGSLVVQAATMVCALVLHLALARLLGDARYGEYVYVLSWVILLAIPATLGMDRVALRYVAAYRARGQLDHIRGLLGRASWQVLAVTTGVALLLAGGVWLLRDTIRPSLEQAFYVGCALLPLAVRQVWNGGLQGFGRVLVPLTLAGVVAPLALAGGVAVLASNAGPGGEVQASQAFAIQLGVAAGMALGLGLWLRRVARPAADTAAPAGGPPAPPRYETAAWLRTGMAVVLITGMHMVVDRADVLLLGAFRPAADVAHYHVASRLAGLVAAPLTALTMILSPMFAHHHAAGERETLQRLLRFGAATAAALGLPIGLALAIGAQPLLALFGQPFTAAAFPLLVLVAGQAVALLCGPAVQLLIMTGHEGVVMRVAVTAATVNLALNAAVIPQFGGAGAAVATAVSLAGMHLACAIAARHRLGVNPSPVAALFPPRAV